MPGGERTASALVPSRGCRGVQEEHSRGGWKSSHYAADSISCCDLEALLGLSTNNFFLLILTSSPKYS